MESSFKKGGVRQRADAAQSSLGYAKTSKKRRQAAENEVMQSVLAQFLIMQWAWGYMSPQDVQRISHLAREDIMRLTGSDHTLPDIDILASIGTNGRYPRNMNRDLQAKYGANRLSKPLTTQMPMMTLSQEFVAAAEQNIFLPHVLFSDLYNQYPNAWRDRICPSMEKLNEFWSEMEGSPQLRDHPITQLENYQSRAIPLSIHGDGVPVTGVGKTWGKSLDVFSWCSLLGVGLTIECNFFIWSIFQKLCCRATLFNTKARFWRILVWSLQILQTGLWPDFDWNGNRDPRGGTPLAGVVGSYFVGVLWVLRGDLDYLCKEMFLPNSSRNDHPCCFCPGNATRALNAFEFRHGQSAWRPRIYTKVAWAHSPFCQHLIFRATTLGVTVLSVAADWMHNKNLGTDQYFYGSVIFLLVYEILPGTHSHSAFFLNMLNVKFKVYNNLKFTIVNPFQIENVFA